jgi:hypothetical protein
MLYNLRRRNLKFKRSFSATTFSLRYQVRISEAIFFIQFSRLPLQYRNFVTVSVFLIHTYSSFRTFPVFIRAYVTSAVDTVFLNNID